MKARTDPTRHLAVTIVRKRGHLYFNRYACDLGANKKRTYRYSILTADRVQMTCTECLAISPAAIEAFRRLPSSVLESLGAWSERTMAPAVERDDAERVA